MKFDKISFFLIVLAIFEFVVIAFWILSVRNSIIPKNIAVYVIYHKNAPIVRNKVLLPMQAGRALHSVKGKMLENIMMGDDTGDNISNKTPGIFRKEKAYCNCRLP